MPAGTTRVADRTDPITVTVTFKDGGQAGRYRVAVSGAGIPPKSASIAVAP